MSTWIDDRIKNLRSRGKKKGDLARLLGIANSEMTRILQGERELKARELAVVADYLEVDIITAFALESKNLNLRRVRLPLKGRAEAGVWRERPFSDEETAEQEYIEADFIGPATPNMFVVEIVGESMNKRFRPGDKVACIPLSEYPIELSSADYVLVERINSTGAREYTVKRLKIDDEENYILEPCSTHPDFQDDIFIGKPHGEEIASENGEIEVRVIAVVSSIVGL